MSAPTDVGGYRGGPTPEAGRRYLVVGSPMLRPMSLMCRTGFLAGRCTSELWAVGGQYRLAALRPGSRATVLPAHQKWRCTANLEMHGLRVWS